MTYKPSLNDLPESGYNPSFTDIPSDEIKQKKYSFPSLKFGKPDYSGLQDIASGLGTAGQNIASVLTGGYAPKVNMQEVIGSKNPNPLLVSAGQYAPALAMGGFKIPQAIGAGLYGASQAPEGERLKQGLETGLGVFGGSKLLSGAGNVFSSLFNKITGKLNPNSIGKLAQNAHDLMSQKAERLFGDVESDAIKKGINNIPINKSIIEESKNYLPKTRPIASLLNKAETGDFSSLRKLQSDLGTKGFKSKSSNLASERDAGEEMLDTRNKINESISKHFIESGHPDLNNKLNEARGIYKDLKDIYYKNPKIGKLVHPEKREIPNNISEIFSRTSKPMERFREAHPDIKEALKQQKTLNSLKKLGIGAGSGAGIAEIYNLLTPKNSNPFSRNE